ncbi:hypothetical protein ACWN8V_07210 [Vagococcus elongatus]|uniref:Uncharacterized protein n=1 Tax=Vagococcus elongatus TaxID=180344 RepID=A0A430AW80_9ENTE|nr:hypothetical protein [Vagococcus elongatus]RSU12321.1 hypothetical protein CBF29_06885 [Vagococcus elongatus]
MINRKTELINQLESENAFITTRIDELIKSKKEFNVKDMADIHRYSETRLFNLKSLSILNGSDSNGC